MTSPPPSPFAPIRYARFINYFSTTVLPKLGNSNNQTPKGGIGKFRPLPLVAIPKRRQSGTAPSPSSIRYDSGSRCDDHSLHKQNKSLDALVSTVRHPALTMENQAQLITGTKQTKVAGSICGGGANQQSPTSDQVYMNFRGNQARKEINPEKTLSLQGSSRELEIRSTVTRRAPYGTEMSRKTKGIRKRQVLLDQPKSVLKRERDTYRMKLKQEHNARRLRIRAQSIGNQIFAGDVRTTREKSYGTDEELLSDLSPEQLKRCAVYWTDGSRGGKGKANGVLGAGVAWLKLRQASDASKLK